MNKNNNYYFIQCTTCNIAGSVKVWDPRQKDKPVVVVMETAEGEKKRECWTVAFGKYWSMSTVHVVRVNWLEEIQVFFFQRWGNLTLLWYPLE